MGVDGKVYAHARVCVDRNGNARCDANESTVFSDKDGKFKPWRRTVSSSPRSARARSWSTRRRTHACRSRARSCCSAPAGDGVPRGGAVVDRIPGDRRRVGHGHHARRGRGAAARTLGPGRWRRRHHRRRHDRPALRQRPVQARRAGRRAERGDRPHRRRRGRHGQEGRPVRRARGPAGSRPHRQRRRHLRREPQLQQPVRQLPRRDRRGGDPRAEEEGRQRRTHRRRIATARCSPSCRPRGAVSRRPASR